MVWGFIASFLIRTVTPRAVQYLGAAGVTGYLLDKVTALLNPTVSLTDLTNAETNQISSIAATNLPDDTKAKLIADLLNQRGTNWEVVAIYSMIVVVIIIVAYMILKRK